jgi:chloramphenicol 3-O-phosphotransferase
VNEIGAQPAAVFRVAHIAAHRPGRIVRLNGNGSARKGILRPRAASCIALQAPGFGFF